MLRRLALLLSILAIAGLSWLCNSERGLNTLLHLASIATSKRLSIEQAHGQLSGPIEIARLSWQDGDLHVVISDIHLDGSLVSLLHGKLNLAELRVDSLHIDNPPSEAPATVPADLQIPISLSIEKVSLASLHYNGKLLASQIEGRLGSDGRQHQLDQLTMQAADVALAGSLHLDGLAPFPLHGKVSVKGQLEERPLALSVVAEGALERIELAAAATQGIEGHASVTLTPFAPAPFSIARLQLEHIDPASWLANAPQADISIVADFEPRQSNILGSFGLTNHRPGPLDKQKLPLMTLGGTLLWEGNDTALDNLHASLTGNGQLTGRGAWQNQALSLDLKAERLDARQLLTQLHTTRLSGSLSAGLTGTQQNLKLDLRDPTFRLLAEATLAEQRLHIPQLALSAGDARLDLQGQLDLTAPRRFTAQGELRDFDPSRFGSLPAARLNTRLQASGHLLPQPVMAAEFTLQESRISGQTVTGQGQVDIAWPRIPKAELTLLAGSNRLAAQGAYGRADDRIKIDIDAPKLAEFGLEGGLRGHWEVFGTPSAFRLSGSLQADRLGWPGQGRLSGMTLDAAFGNDANAPLQLALSIANLDLPNQPGLIRALNLRGSGNNQSHRLSVEADVSGKNHLTLQSEGRWEAATSFWQGQMTDVRMESKDSSRNFQLIAPAQLALSANSWQFGLLRLAGNPLDWQATLEGKADTRQLSATLNARGSRIGQVDGQLRAPMQTAWSLARDTRWQGSLRTRINDLGWLAELIGEGWQSEGQLNGELQLSGTPRIPLINGQLRGGELALRLPAQGLSLARG
jgi:translocation and assembly module TamB